MIALAFALLASTAAAQELSGEGAIVCVVDSGIEGDFDLLEPSSDDDGHGTALATVVREVAPGARFLAVDALREGERSYHDDDLIAGLRTCAAHAPGVVALLAIGSHEGAHDGSEALERVIDELAAEMPIVVAAGNDRPGVYARGVVAPGETLAIDLRVPAPRNAAPRIELLAIHEPRVELAMEGAERERALDRTRLIVTPRESGFLRATVRGAGAFDLYLAGQDLGDVVLPASLAGESVLGRAPVAVPGTARGAITVTAVAGDRVAGFAPRGPSRDGYPKPDVAAPSEGGTSFAAAYVAGVFALAIEDAPYREDDRKTLRATARGGAWDPALGAGIVNIDAFIAARRDGVRNAATALTRSVARPGETIWLATKDGDPRALVVPDAAPGSLVTLEGHVLRVALDPQRDGEWTPGGCSAHAGSPLALVLLTFLGRRSAGRRACARRRCPRREDAPTGS